jgi:putative FmdB family regulatory protein
MPMYEYTCRVCRERFELFRAIAERDEPARCSHCGDEQKQLRVPAAVFGQLGGGAGAGAPAGCGPAGGSGFR